MAAASPLGVLGSSRAERGPGERGVAGSEDVEAFGRGVDWAAVAGAAAPLLRPLSSVSRSITCRRSGMGGGVHCQN